MNKISFIIPVYNCANYLFGCVDSIRKIGLINYEILLIDDGSTDGSGKLCDNMVNDYDYIRCYHQKNSGVSSARNVGLDQAEGDYVIFVDSDDYLEPSNMKKIAVYLNNISVDCVIFGMAFDYYHKGILYRQDELRPPFEGLIEKKYWIRDLEQLYKTNSLSSTCNKIYRRQFLLTNKLRLREDMFLYEDFEYTLRCLSCAEQILFVSDIVYHYRQSEDEGNAGRRLKRICYLPNLIEKIEFALIDVIGDQDEVESKNQINKILLSLYLVLAREKISVSDRYEIKRVCDDFYSWYEMRNIITVEDDQKNYVELLLKHKIGRLMIKRTYISFRHKIAVLVKAVIKQNLLKGGILWK